MKIPKVPRSTQVLCLYGSPLLVSRTFSPLTQNSRGSGFFEIYKIFFCPQQQLQAFMSGMTHDTMLNIAVTRTSLAVQPSATSGRTWFLGQSTWYRSDEDKCVWWLGYFQAFLPLGSRKTKEHKDSKDASFHLTISHSLAPA